MKSNLTKNNSNYFQTLRSEILKDESFQLIQELNIEKQKVFELNEHIKNIENSSNNKINELNEIIRSIYTSSSWRLTTPIRSLKNIYNSLTKNKTLKKDENLGNFDANLNYDDWIKTIENNSSHCLINNFSTKFTIFLFILNNNTYEEVNQTFKSLSNIKYENFNIRIIDATLNSIDYSKALNILDKCNLKYNVSRLNLNLTDDFFTTFTQELSNTEWSLFLFGGDCLAELAFENFNSVIQTSQVDLIYTDEDSSIDLEKNLFKRNKPHFKPDFNQTLYYSNQYINRSFLISNNLLKATGQFNINNINTNFTDLILKSIELINDKKKIHHVSKVLFHTNPNFNNKNLDQTCEILMSHFKRINKNVKISKLHELNAFHLEYYFFKNDSPLVSIIIPTRNGLNLLSRCITSIITETTYLNYELIIVDNGSNDPKTLSYLKNIECEFIKIIRDDSPFNYSNLNNSAVDVANGEYICLMNNDTEIITKNWLEEMMAHACQENVGCVGAKLLYPNNKVQHGGVILGIGGLAGHAHWNLDRNEPGYFNRAMLAQELSAVTAACLLVKKSIYEEVGGLDPNLAVAFNDVNFCLDVLNKGYRNIWTPFAELYHFESASRGYEDTPEKIKRFKSELDSMQLKWGNCLLKDPAYNVNLCLQTTISVFTLNFKPR